MPQEKRGAGQAGAVVMIVWLLVDLLSAVALFGAAALQPAAWIGFLLLLALLAAVEVLLWDVQPKTPLKGRAPSRFAPARVACRCLQSLWALCGLLIAALLVASLVQGEVAYLSSAVLCWHLLLLGLALLLALPLGRHPGVFWDVWMIRLCLLFDLLAALWLNVADFYYYQALEGLNSASLLRTTDSPVVNGVYLALAAGALIASLIAYPLRPKRQTYFSWETREKADKKAVS